MSTAPAGSVQMVRVHALDGPTALRFDSVPRPALGPGEVRVAVRAAGVNFPDYLMTEGRYQARPEPPFSPGLEVAGEVLEVAPDCARFAAGDRVIVRTGADLPGFAEETVAPEARCLPAPEGLSWAEAATLHVGHWTALHALADRGRLAPGETLLVFGASGGVGLAAVAVGRAMGARVIAAAGSEAKRAAVRAAGAEAVLDARAPDIGAEVAAVAGRRSVDVVLDLVGGAAFEAGLKALRPEGRMLVAGFAGGAPDTPVRANYVLIKEIEVIGVRAGSWDRRRPGAAAAGHARLTAWLAEGRLPPPRVETLPLVRAAEALERLARRDVIGKLALIP